MNFAIKFCFFAVKKSIFAVSKFTTVQNQSATLNKEDLLNKTVYEEASTTQSAKALDQIAEIITDNVSSY